MNRCDKAFIYRYLETALWSSNDERDKSGGEFLDANYSIEDIALESVKQAVKDCLLFISLSDEADLIDDYEQAGHDFWLTRNRHGAGFWDRGLGEKGDKLTELSEKFTELSPYVGTNNKIYL